MEIQMEMKKFSFALLATVGIIASASTYAGSPSTSRNGVIEKITIQPIDGAKTQFGKCPPFCI
jgi:hypothetical protein